MFHKTTPELQDQVQDRSVQDQDQDHSLQDQDRFFWSQTGLVLRPTVSDHITVFDGDNAKLCVKLSLRPNFGGSPLFMSIPFDIDRPNSSQEKRVLASQPRHCISRKSVAEFVSDS